MHDLMLMHFSLEPSNTHDVVKKLRFFKLLYLHREEELQQAWFIYFTTCF